MVKFANQQVGHAARMLSAGAVLLVFGLTISLNEPGFAQSLTPPENATPEEQLQFWEELAYWEAVKDSDIVTDIESYLLAYPQGHFKALAEVRIKILQERAGVKSAEKDPGTQGVWYIALSNSNVRTEPGTHSDKIGVIERNSRVLVIAEVDNGNWYEVELANGETGFVYAKLLQKEYANSQDSVTPASTEVDSSSNTESTVQSSTTTPASATAGTLINDCAGCPELVVIPPGRFTMGADDQRREEKPRHDVSITYSFALGRTEVTVGEWQLCVLDGACKFVPEGEFAEDPQLPVSNVSWDDAQQYLRWLSAKAGVKYRLPSEAEWEYAARGGTTSKYYWGDNAVAAGRANCTDCGSQWDGKSPAPVASFPPGAHGLFDMHGNLWEWTEDCWNRDYQGAPGDGSAWTKGDCLARVQRGGTWRLDADYMRVSRRGKYDRDVRYFLNGFRVARDIP